MLKPGGLIAVYDWVMTDEVCIRGGECWLGCWPAWCVFVEGSAAVARYWSACVGGGGKYWLGCRDGDDRRGGKCWLGVFVVGSAGSVVGQHGVYCGGGKCWFGGRSAWCVYSWWEALAWLPA